MGMRTAEHCGGNKNPHPSCKSKLQFLQQYTGCRKITQDPSHCFFPKEDSFLRTAALLKPYKSFTANCKNESEFLF
jgi:hypothetical protein